jgi:hypothetical protein
VVDQDYGSRRLTHWAAGAPRKSFMSGTKRPEDEPIPIGVYRCESCGYLESYARPEFGAS